MVPSRFWFLKLFRKVGPIIERFFEFRSFL